MTKTYGPTAVQACRLNFLTSLTSEVLPIFSGGLCFFGLPCYLPFELRKTVTFPIFMRFFRPKNGPDQSETTFANIASDFDSTRSAQTNYGVLEIMCDDPPLLLPRPFCFIHRRKHTRRQTHTHTHPDNVWLK